LDFEPVDADDGVAVVHEVVRQGESGRTHTRDQHLAAGRPQGQGPPGIERIPAREQRVDLESPGQLEHVLQRARLDLRDVYRLLLLVDAGFYAVASDTAATPCAGRVVDD